MPSIGPVSSAASRSQGARLAALVARASDRTLERTAGSRAGLHLLFGRLAARFDPVAAEGFQGEIACALRRGDGTVTHWTVAVDGGRASARPRRAERPAVTVRASVADLVRMAARELDPGRALLDGRLDLEGDARVATRLGAMFGAGRLM